MEPVAEEIRWWVGMALMGIFSWTGAGLVTRFVPMRFLDTHTPLQQRIAQGLIAAVGGGSAYFFLRDWMGYVWLGLKHILFLDVQ